MTTEDTSTEVACYSAAPGSILLVLLVLPPLLLCLIGFILCIRQGGRIKLHPNYCKTLDCDY